MAIIWKTEIEMSQDSNFSGGFEAAKWLTFLPWVKNCDAIRLEV